MPATEIFFAVSFVAFLVLNGTLAELYYSLTEHGKILWTPRDFHKHTEYSLAGSWIAFIVICIISPIMAIIKLIRWLRIRKRDK